MNLVVRKSPSKRRRGDAEGTWAKIVFDRQIVAIAKSHGANVIYSDDGGLEKFARQQALTVIKTWELSLPPAKQIVLPGVEPRASKARRVVFEDADNPKTPDVT